MYARQEAEAHAYHGNVEETGGGYRPTSRRYPMRGLRRLASVDRGLRGVVETGPQRAQRRAAHRGLIVGAPVRADMLRQAARCCGRQRPAPLDFVQRIGAYRNQIEVRGEVLVAVTGKNWRPTPRQRRRLAHKSRHAMAPFGRKAPDPLGGWAL